MDTAPASSVAVTACIEEAGDGPCILDLTAVTFLDSAGLTALLQATSHTEAHCEPLRIVVDSNRPVTRPIEVTCLDDVLMLYRTVDEALKGGKSRGRRLPRAGSPGEAEHPAATALGRLTFLSMHRTSSPTPADPGATPTTAARVH
jgi:anti-anti-sigma factor